jgi:putative membrane protein
MVEKERTPRPGRITGQSSPDWISVELSARRTGMSFQRTRMSADRTLMSVIRTSLSLIGFGFTIFQIFQKMFEAKVLPSIAPARHFGTALLVLGCLMLIMGIAYHIAFMIGLRKERIAMRDDGLIHARSHFPVSLTLMTAFLLLLVGLLAMASVVFELGPFE